MTDVPQRVPALLWDSLQEMCWRHDTKFLSDVAKIIKIPVGDIKKQILGSRGVYTVIPFEHGPWWMNTQCPAMELVGGTMWRRCGGLCEQGDSCWTHRDGRHRRHDDPYFATLPKRRPMRYEGVVYWVDVSGGVMNGFGTVMQFRMDLNTKTVVKTNGLDLGAVTKTSEAQKTESAMESTEENSQTC